MATSKSAWQLMLTGHPEEALCQMQESYARRGSLSESMELGVAYLWLGEYMAAWEHFDGVNRKHPKASDLLYAMAGAAKWCLGDRCTAVEQWADGCYCDGTNSGGFGSPLLLFAASIIDPSAYVRSEAEKLLTERANDPWARHWPKAIAEYLLGRIDETTLRRACVGINTISTASAAGSWIST